uniref:Leucine-rich pentatricopeptide repeat containing n=1 Tax=Lates calcarifer TaxID=8187 RepID=A0A4W6DPC9_LATCA
MCVLLGAQHTFYVSHAPAEELSLPICPLYLIHIASVTALFCSLSCPPPPSELSCSLSFTLLYPSLLHKLLSSTSISLSSNCHYYFLYSRVWPYAVGCVRGYTVATEKKDEGGVAVRSKQAQQFDWALTKLDSSVRRTGRITKTLLLHIFHDMCRTGYPSGNQALLLLRSCGSLLPEVPLEERSALAHHMWEKLQELGVHFDVSHYNALLKVYLQNEFKFSPTDFLAKMEAANVQPNRVSPDTYVSLLNAYAEKGDLDMFTTVLMMMHVCIEQIVIFLITHLCTSSSLLLLFNPSFFSTTLHSFCFFPQILLSSLFFLPASQTHTPLSLCQTMEEAESADCSLMDKDIMQIILTLSKAGHHQHVPEMAERLRHERGFVPDAMNLCLNLITLDLCVCVCVCVCVLQAVEKISHYCKELQESNLHSSPFIFSLQCALGAKNTDMSLKLMKILKEQGSPIRPHFFFPLLSPHLKDNNTAGIRLLEVVKAMQELGVSPDIETLSQYIVPAFPSISEAQQALKVIHNSVCECVYVYILKHTLFIFTYVALFSLYFSVS